MIYVEGIKFRVDWKSFAIGSTFWVPCLDPDDVIFQITKKCREMGMEVKAVKSIENGFMGVRAWRMPTAIDIIKGFS